jgi:general stress protein 26/predicted SnoaL-like aldol condensation-catalyzing enzyme
MSHIELSFEDAKHRIVEEITQYQFGYLATTDGEAAYVREIRFIPDDLTLYCFTDKRSRKRKQIKKNPNVAVAYGNHKLPNRGVQIEGYAFLRGHPLDEENRDMHEAYRRTAPEAYERSMKRHFVRSRPNLSVIKIEPRRAALMVQGATAAESYLDIIDVERETAHRIMVNVGDNIKSPVYQGKVQARSLEEKNKAVVHRWVDEMYAERRFDLMPELAGPLYIRHESSGTSTVTIEEHMKKTIERYGGPERIEGSEQSYQLFAEGDKVCMIGTYKGYRKGGESDRDVYNFVQVFRLKDGKIVETWFPGFVKNVDW